MTEDSREVLIFTPTPNEYLAVSGHVGRQAFKNFKAVVLECGPGKINATFKLTSELLPRLSRGRRPALIVGSGTSGSLSLSLSEGDVIASSSVVISDWRMEDGRSRQFSPYGRFDYRPLNSRLAEEMTISCDEPLVKNLISELSRRGYKSGSMMTSDTFVAGKDNKLSSGRDFSCLACDMESGAFAFTAQNLSGGLPWLNLRVVADTLDESLTDYFNKEVSMVDILGLKTAEALQVLDQLYETASRSVE